MRIYIGAPSSEPIKLSAAQAFISHFWAGWKWLNGGREEEEMIGTLNGKHEKLGDR